MSKFEVKQTKSGGYVFNLKATNGQVIASSQTYKSKKTCLNGVKSVAVNAPKANIEDQTVEGYAKAKCPKFEIYTDKAGESRFRLKATNGQIIATSEGYKTMKSCTNGVASVQKNAPVAEIVDAE